MGPEMPEGRELEHEEERLRATNGRVEAGTVEAVPPEEEVPSLLENPRRLAITSLIVLLMFGAIYVLVPKLVGLEDAIAKMQEGEWQWFAVAVGFNVCAFGSYVALFRGVVGENLVHLDWRESYQITMAGLAASRVLSAGGAGGVVLSYWALRKAGMRRAEAAERMVAFLVLLYAFYVIAVIVFGVLLRVGVLPGARPGVDDDRSCGDRRRRRARLHADHADPRRPAAAALAAGEQLGQPAGPAAEHGARDDLHRVPGSRSASSASRAGAGSRSSARPDSGRRTSASSGRRSRRSGSRCRSVSW